MQNKIKTPRLAYKSFFGYSLSYIYIQAFYINTFTTKMINRKLILIINSSSYMELNQRQV